MTQVTAFLQAASRYWYILAAAVVLLALAGYAVAYARALRPRAGTLEWIAAYDRPRFGLHTQASVLDGHDMLGLLTGALLAAATQLLSAYLNSFGDVLSFRFFALYGGPPVVSAVLTYLLLKRLCGSTAAATLGSCLLAVNLLLTPVMAFAAAATLFTCRFAAKAEEGTFASNAPNLLLTASILTVGCYFAPPLCLLAPALLVVMIAACVMRFTRHSKPDGYLPKTLILLLLTTGLTALFLFVPAALVAGGRFPQFLFSAEYYRMLTQRWGELFTIGQGFFPFASLWRLYFDWPLLLTGLLSVLAAFCALVRRRDGRGLILPLLFLGCAAMFLVGGVYVMPLACVAGLCYVWSGLLVRSKKALVAVGAAVLLAAQLALYVPTYFF